MNHRTNQPPTFSSSVYLLLICIKTTKPFSLSIQCLLTTDILWCFKLSFKSSLVIKNWPQSQLLGNWVKTFHPRNFGETEFFANSRKRSEMSQGESCLPLSVFNSLTISEWPLGHRSIYSFVSRQRKLGRFRKLWQQKLRR